MGICVGLLGTCDSAWAQTEETPPDAPANLTATPGDGWISLTWTPWSPGVDENDAPIRGRVVWHEFRQETAGTWSGWKQIANSYGPQSGGADRGINSSFLLVPNLKNGTTYSFEVRARNFLGYSAPSSVVSATPAGIDPKPTLAIQVVPGREVAIPGAAGCPVGQTETWFRIRADGAEHLWHRSASKGVRVKLDFDLGAGYDGRSDSGRGLVPLNATSNVSGNRYWDMRQCFWPGLITNNVGFRLLDDSDYVVGSQRQISLDASTYTATMSVSDADAHEDNDRLADFVVTLQPAQSTAITVQYATSDGTATAGADYTQKSGTLTFAAGETEKTISVIVLDDTVADNEEKFTLTLSNPSAGVHLGRDKATGTIRNTDYVVSVADASALEGEDDEMIFVVSINREPEFGLVELLYATSDGTATAGEDYTAKGVRFPMAVVFLKGRGTEQEIKIPILNDTVEDSGETFMVTLSTSTTGVHIENPEAIGTIMEPGAEPPTSSLSVADAEASEGETVDFVVTLDPVVSDTVTVDYTTSDGTATVGNDYTKTSGTLTFQAGEIEQTVSVPITSDTANDDGETLTLTLSNPSGAEISDADATGTIRDAVEETAKLSVADAQATEGEDRTLDFVVTLDPAASGTVTVDYATSDGTATAGEDYTETSGTLEFAAGETEKTVSVPVTDDTAADDAETLTLTLTSASGADVSDAEATGTIRDGDVPLTASLDLPDEHDASDFTFTLSFSEEPDVSYVDLKDHAFDVTNGEVRKARRQQSGNNQHWTITIRPDGGADVTVKLPATTDCDAVGAICTEDGRKLSNSTSETVAGPADEPTVDVADASATEGEDIVFTVTLSKANSDEVTVDYATAAGTATDGTDFTGNSGTLTFAANETSKTVSVTTTDDTSENEGDETFTLTLTNPTNATLGTETATGTILDNDASLPTVSVADASAEEGESVEFTVTLSTATSQQVTVEYATSGGSATSGTDFSETNGALTFSANETSKTVTVTTTEDESDEDDETFTLTLTNPTNATLGNASATATIEDDDEPPLTATFQNEPREHDGESTFTFQVLFSEDIPTSYTVLRNEAFDVSGGTVDKAKRVNGRDDLREIHIEPTGYGTISISLPATTDCNASGAICMDDGRKLSNSNSATVAGPVGISVADAQVEEDEGALLAFVVTLSRAASGTLTVDYATSDGNAQAGVDYTAVSDTLTFAAGESSKTIEVAVLDDSHDEGEETLTLTLSNPSSGRLTDGEATGTIENRDPLPRALLARFGRTAAVHVVEQVEERIAAPREPGIDGRFAGFALRPGMDGYAAGSLSGQFGAPVGANGMRSGLGGPMSAAPLGGAGALGTPGLGGGGIGMASAAGPMGGMSAPGYGMMTGGGLLQMGYGGDDLLTGSAFSLNRETRQGGILSFWSRGARSYFSGREGTLSLGGDVRTTMFGADYAKGPLMAGLSLSHSQGLGEYSGAAGGQLATAVTGLYPWLGYKATDRITVWGVGGYGVGGMLLTPGGGPALESGLSMAMAAAGTRGELVAGGAGGFELAFKADALWVGTSTDGVDGPAGRLKATDAAVTRFRTGLEGSRGYTFAGRLLLTPSVEVGLRHDGGDAENGAGMDIGGGLVLADATTGLAVDMRVRMLVVHQDEGFRERGMALSLSYNPTPSTPLGFMARVAPSWGGQAMGGAQALWGRESMAGMAHGGFASGNRLDGEVGYGLPVGSRFVGTPRVGFSTSEYGRDYRVGYGLGVLDRESLNFEVGVDAQRRESPLVGGTDHGAIGRATVTW